MKARLAYVNILAKDIDALSSFYMSVFSFREIEGHRSPIYRCLEAGGVELGFNAPLAGELLNIQIRCPERGDGLATYITFEMESVDALEDTFHVALAYGARVLMAPYDTYYNARQCVLEDPEGNCFRINVRRCPRIPVGELSNPPWASRS